MAFQLNNNKKMVSDINVTPFVDITLVLLVIFMITAPLMLSGIKLNLPKTKEVNRVALTTKQIVLSITKNNEFFVEKTKIDYKDLDKVLKNKLERSKNDVLYIRADSDLRYGKVTKVMSFLKRSGIDKIALVTEVEK